MADLTSLSTYTLNAVGSQREFTIDVTSASQTTSDTVDSRFRNVISVVAQHRSTAGFVALQNSLTAAANGTNANNNINIMVARSSESIGIPFTLIVRGR